MSSRPRSPGLMHAVVVLVLVLLLGILTLTQRQPPPPSIAEFAPQAVENITDAPSDATSSSGSRSGTGTSEGAGAIATPPPEPTDVPRVRKCVGDPPRQIEDPQSPPCVPYWAGDNGGATARGVTRDEITVAVSSGGGRTQQDLRLFFNKRFEFYGRHLTFKDPGAPRGHACELRKADAVKIIDELKAFAAIVAGGDREACFVEEAARRHLLSVSLGQWTAEKDLAAGDPYLWQYMPTTDESMANWGRWTCAHLAGANAAYATDTSFRSRRRVFGLLVQAQQTPYGVETTPIDSELARCGERFVVKHVAYSGDNASFRDESVNTIIKMQAEGVTTALCSCPTWTAEYVPTTASSQGYFPEWVLNDGLSRSGSVKLFWPDQAQRRSMIGFTMMPLQVRPPDVAMNWALAEAEPGYVLTTGTDLAANLPLYWELLLLASAIQMAGPRLTPETFRDGLYKTVFPNPAVPPLREGWVGFPRSHGMVHDAARMWWSETSLSPYPDEGTGTWCYAEGGRRYKIDEWKTGPDQLFQSVCHTIPAGLD